MSLDHVLVACPHGARARPPAVRARTAWMQAVRVRMHRVRLTQARGLRARLWHVQDNRCHRLRVAWIGAVATPDPRPSRGRPR